jgi:GTP 3',8-cyclase
MGLTLPVIATRGDTPPRAPHAAGPHMIDSHGRRIRDLRLSITDRCNFRCTYCMEPDARFMPKMQLLTNDEFARLARLCIGLGVEKVRITGGEPTVHPDLVGVIERLAALKIRDLAMTTNGALADEASLRRWKTAGLTRITISIDAVDPAIFKAMARSSVGPDRILAAIESAIACGYKNTKLDAVIVRGQNESQIVPLAALARRFGVEMRFIEFMPLDSAHAWDRARVVPADEIARTIHAAFPIRATGRDDPSSTALTYTFEDGTPGRIGLIAPVSRPFCGACSRLRITADGKVRPCLFSRQEWDLRALLRDGSTDAQLAQFLIDATWTKQAGHGISSAAFVQPERAMFAIGG